MTQLKPLSKKLRDALARANPVPAHPSASGSMRVKAAGDDTVELLIYGNIGASWWDEESITAKSVVEALKDTTAKTISVRINSYGGSVSDGFVIHNELRRQAKAGIAIEVSIDGAACSIASLIAAAGDTVTMPSNTLQMLHAPWGVLFIEGNAKEAREVAEEFASVLDTFGKAMATSYSRKTGKPTSEFIAMWDTGKDYWYTAEEAKSFGLCDAVIDEAEPEVEEAADDSEASALLLQQLIEHAPPELTAQIHASFNPSTPTAAQRAAPNPQASARDTQPAAAGATTGDTEMADPKKPADTMQAAPLQNDVQAAMVALRERNTDILAMAEPHMGNAEIKAYVDGVIAAADTAITAGAVGKQILAMMAAGREPLNGGGHVVAGGDARDNRIKGMSEAIDARLGRVKAEAGNQYRGLTLKEMARECAQAAGVNTRGMEPEQYVQAAITHTSSDFPQLIGGAVSRAVLRGYNDTPEVFPEFTRAISVPDFKKQSLVGLGHFIGIEEVPEGGEYKYGKFSSLGQEVQLRKLGGMFSITDEAIINDDLSLFDAVPSKMGAATKRALGDRVFALLTANPVLADGVTLFHATHNNLLSGTAPTTASVDAMIAKMALQKDANGETVRVPLKFILVPVGLGGIVRQILDSQFEIGTGAAQRNLTAPNYVRGRFVVIEDPRLDANSTTAWYGVADPAVIDSIVIAYRNGQQEPKVEQKQGWNVDGIEFKVRLDAAPAIADYVGLNKNPGA